jgi:hypothetical protein
MKNFIRLAVVLPLAVAVGACSKPGAGPGRIASPAATVEGTKIVEAHFIRSEPELAAAAAAVARHPLFRTALSSAGAARLSATPQYTVREVATLEGGGSLEFTMLPFIVNGDSSHAFFATLARMNDRERILVSELIAGRDPKWDEVGFTAVSFQGETIWVKDGDSYAVNAGAPVRLAPERFNPMRMLQCMLETAGPMCAMGATIGSTVAPEFPAVSAAVGCAVGTAVSVGLCVADSLGK